VLISQAIFLLERGQNNRRRPTHAGVYAGVGKYHNEECVGKEMTLTVQHVSRLLFRYVSVFRCPLCVKERKMKLKSICIAPFIYYVYLKAVRHRSHSFICKYTMPAFPS